jgi:hypothetical protein
MERKETLRLLNKFVDRNRSGLSEPFSQQLRIGKYICATNARFICCIPETDENRIENNPALKPPSIDKILPDFKNQQPFNFSVLLKQYEDMPLTERFKMLECESCEGRGEFRHYGNMYECKECDQMGEVQTCMKETCKNPNTVFRYDVDGIRVDILLSYIEWLIEIYNLVQPKEVTIADVRRNLIWFRLDDTYVAISGVPDIEEERKQYDIIPLIQKLNTEIYGKRV